MSHSWRLLFTLAGAVPLVSGCYTYVPVDTSASAPVGKRVALEITDRGRVALSDRFGAGVLRVEGIVEGNTTQSQYELKVWRVAQFNGQSTPWSGESVRLDRNFVGSVFERRLSRGRSFLAAGVTFAVLVWVGNSQGLFGHADVLDDPTVPPPPPSSSRIP